ncbi:hypothetical protein [Niallia sp.]|uniref:hypothetical protein n=1 Tax=Niallia sp. TaxID=2837523 RepID=UPI00289CE844|nr:hypothetical protein [Niallia sp.]
MKSKNSILKIAVDLSWLKFTWALWVIPIVFIVYNILRYFIGEEKFIQQGFLPFVYGPTKIFMLVVGIISVSGFLTFYVKQGIPRKDYFYGQAISAVIVSFSMMLIGFLIALVEKEFVLGIHIDSYLGQDPSWLLLYFIYSLNVVGYFVAGWLIGAGFYRFGVLIGMAYIALAVLILSIIDRFWEFELKDLFGKILFFNGVEFSVFLSFLGTILLILLVLWINRITLKKVAVKMK